MNWISLLIPGAFIAIILLLKRAGQISVRAARDCLKKGALVVDVRSRGEFASGHLPGAINIPLDEIETALPAKANNKNQPVLLHCASGMRSAMARRKLKSLGYTNASNLGSYHRAERILKTGG